MSMAITRVPQLDKILKEIEGFEHLEATPTAGGFNSHPTPHPSNAHCNAMKRLPIAADPTTSSAKIMIIDDEPINVKVCQKYLGELGYKRCVSVTDATRAMSQIEFESPDLLILDIMMPNVSGIDILQLIRSSDKFAQLPVLILTAASDRTTKLTVLELGASDFLTKPIDPSELAPRVRNALTVKRYHDSLQDYAHTLEEAVRTRTAELEASRMDAIHCLARAVEYRDDNTGRHVQRVGRYTRIIAEAMGQDAETCRMIEMAAQLHDVGKVGVPDDVLLKPGKLSPDEYELIQKHTLYGRRIVEQMSEREWERARQHVQIGSKILEVPRSPLLVLAARIALTHHERWDGTGYPIGLAGEDIPLEGRMTTVADVFDALSSRRPYKPAFSLDRCWQIMSDERGKQFDPAVIDAFFSQRDRIVSTQIELADEE